MLFAQNTINTSLLTFLSTVTGVGLLSAWQKRALIAQVRNYGVDDKESGRKHWRKFNGLNGEPCINKQGKWQCKSTEHFENKQKKPINTWKPVLIGQKWVRVHVSAVGFEHYFDCLHKLSRVCDATGMLNITQLNDCLFNLIISNRCQRLGVWYSSISMQKANAHHILHTFTTGLLHR